jgi:uncharacterized OB-fold protein
MSDKPLPNPTADSDAFWAACAEGRFTLQLCNSCQTAQHYPRSLCTSCGSHDLEMVEASGRGEVFSFTINHRAPRQAFAENGNYVIALVDLEEGPRMMMNVIGCDPSEVTIGMPVRIVFEERGDMKLPQATPA